MLRRAPYGSWASPITLDLLVEDAVGLSFPLAGDDSLYWTEGRASEGGRQVVVRRRPGGRSEDVFGPEFNARSAVHEYGGRSYGVIGETVVFSNFADQRLYRVCPGAAPEPITPEPSSPRALRFVAPLPTADGGHVIVVRERHGGDEATEHVRNDIVGLRIDASAPERIIASGHDFYGRCSLSPDGRRLAYVTWDHPDMPWDHSELWEAGLDERLDVISLRRVAGAPGESIIQPAYSPAGVLHFISDRTGYWNLYAERGGVPVALAPMASDLGQPDWVFGNSAYAFLADGTVIAGFGEAGRGCIGALDEVTRAFVAEISLPGQFTNLEPLGDAGGVVALLAAPDRPSAVVCMRPGSGELEVVRQSRTRVVESGYLSMPEPITFPTGGGLESHAWYYPPRNADFEAPPGERPPLLVRSHGGPTSAASRALNYAIQFWTSRGIGVVDVDYGGSTGYGRAYRERLKGNWGIVDVDDCVNAAVALVERGLADGARLLIHGGSAGGFTTLCALVFRDVFAAGASSYGIGDVAALARDTHKFEAHYVDSLIGPWPQAMARYEERSPVRHLDAMRTPTILFQGLEDKVVPPSQAETMVAALAQGHIPHAYVAFAGEQHGFRRAETIRRVAEAELYFYARVLGFRPADVLEPVEIAEVDQLKRP